MKLKDQKIPSDSNNNEMTQFIKSKIIAF